MTEPATDRAVVPVYDIGVRCLGGAYSKPKPHGCLLGDDDGKNIRACFDCDNVEFVMRRV